MASGGDVGLRFHTVFRARVVLHEMRKAGYMELWDVVREKRYDTRTGSGICACNLAFACIPGALRGVCDTILIPTARRLMRQEVKTGHVHMNFSCAIDCGRGGYLLNIDHHFQAGLVTRAKMIVRVGIVVSWKL